jgi:nucleotide-binding universal stress UspA family protein
MKKMKILIGYDGSPCADAALDDLNRAGLAREGKACVLSVAELWLPPPAPSAFEIVAQANQVHVPYDLKRVYARGSAAMKEAQSLAERAANRLRSNFPGWEISAEAASGSPAWELVLKADQWHPDLIVVGSHGRSAVGRLILGSVSQRVLTESRCSVRVARGRLEEPDTPVRILVGVDGSPTSELAVREVASRIWPPGSEVRVVIANDPLTPTFVGQFIPAVTESVDETNQAELQWHKQVARSSIDILDRAELKASSEIREGDPKRVLLDVAEEWGADCIFAGSVGFSNRFERFVLGSVSSAVAARAHCSVEVVRRKENKGGNHHEREFEYSRN